MRIVFAAAISAALVVPASAQTTVNWTGFYGGVDLGYSKARGNAQTSTSAFANRGESNFSGFTGGAHLGYRVQLPSQWVLGIEGDLWRADLQGVGQNTAFGLYAPLDVKSGGSLRGVIGLASGATLFYATGGMAFASFSGCAKTLPSFPCFAQSDFSENKTGFTVGFGAERALSPHWSARLEYLYADYGTSRFSTLNVFPDTVSLQTHSLRLGLNYSFTPHGTVHSAPPMANWTGWYAGADVGGLVSSGDLYILGQFFHATSDPQGATFGGHIGYRRQFASNFVLGFEADIWGSNAKGSATFVNSAVNTGLLNIHTGGSLRGTAGYAFANSLLYATAGATLADVSFCTTATDTCAVGSEGSGTRHGWTAGLGIAHFISPRVIARVEYLYADYGSKTFFTPATNGNLTTVELATHVMRAGLSWKFNSN